MDFDIPEAVNVTDDHKADILSRYRRVKGDPFLVGRMAIVFKNVKFNHKNGNKVDFINCVGRVVGVERNDEEEQISMLFHENSRWDFKFDVTQVFYGLATDVHTPSPAVGRRGALMSEHALATGRKVDALSVGKIKATKMDGLFVTIHFGHLNGGRGADVEVPGAVVAVLAPDDAAKGHGRMVKLRTNLGSRKKNDLGRVVAVSATLWRVDVEFLDGEVVQNVESPRFEFGAFCGDVTIRLNKTTTPGKAKQRTFENTTKHDYLAKHAFQLLRDIYIRCDNKLPGINRNELNMFKTDDEAWDIADGFSEGIKLASPKLHDDVYQRKAFNWADVLQNATPFDKADDHKGVIYGRGATKFKSGSQYKDTAFYTGETTRALADREVEHVSSTTTEAKSIHYKAMSDARKILVVFLFKLPRRWANLSNERKERLLHICEQLTVLMLKTYHSNVLGDMKISKNLSNTADLQLFLSSSWVLRNQATSLAAIAEESFKSTGWPGIGKSNLSPTGQGEGLNIASPMTVTHTPSHDRIVWSRMYHPSAHRTVFTRGSGTELRQNQNNIMFMSLRVTGSKGNTHALHYATGHAEAAKYGPVLGTPLTAIQVEFMDEDAPAKSESQRGLHPIPFFKCAELMLGNQRRRVLGIGIKIFWKEGSKHYWRYISDVSAVLWQPNPQPYVRDALVLRNFLMHETLANRPDHIPDPGFARVIEVKIDILRQEALVRPFLAVSPVTYELLGDTHAAADIMRAAGLQRVDAPWPGPQPFTGGKLQAQRQKAELPHQKTTWTKHMNRTACDFCYVTARVRDPACTKANIVCSWTDTIDLLGMAVLDLGSTSNAAIKARAIAIRDGATQSTDPKWAPLKRTMTLFNFHATDVRIRLAKTQILPDEMTLTTYDESDDEPIE